VTRGYSGPLFHFPYRDFRRRTEPNLNDFITPVGIFGASCEAGERCYVPSTGPVTKHDFHKHCHFVRPVSGSQERKQLSYHAPLPPSPPLPNIFAPHVVQTRGLLRKVHSTRRNPSAFELTAGTRVHRPGRVGGESFPAPNSSQITISTPSENAVAVIQIDDPMLTHSQTTSQEQENDDQLLAEMVVQVTEVTHINLMSGIQAAQPPATTPAAATAAAAKPAGRQPKKRGRPKGSKDKQPQSRNRTQTGTQAGD